MGPREPLVTVPPPKGCPTPKTASLPGRCRVYGETIMRLMRNKPPAGVGPRPGPPSGGYSRERLAGGVLPGVPSVILPDGPLHSRGSTTSSLEVLGVTYYQSILVICTDFTDFSDS